MYKYVQITLTYYMHDDSIIICIKIISPLMKLEKNKKIVDIL